MKGGNKMAIKAPTHHIAALPGEFAKTVLMPGDPMRAKFIAENYLEDYKLINEIRCMYAYTGFYKGKRVSVMGGGMGGASTANHVWELYHLYDVETIIRVGTAGGFQPWLELYDIIIALCSCHDTSYHEQYKLGGTFAPLATFALVEKAVAKARDMGVSFHVGNLFTSNAFYSESPEDKKKFAQMGCLGVDQETAVLYMTAASAGKKALAIDTVSDHLWKESRDMTAQERQDNCRPMLEIALEIAED